MFWAKIVGVIFYAISIIGITVASAGFFLFFLIGVTGIILMAVGIGVVLSNILLFEMIDYFVKNRHKSILPKNRKSFLSKVTAAIVLLLFLLTLWDFYKPKKSMYFMDFDENLMEKSDIIPKFLK